MNKEFEDQLPILYWCHWVFVNLEGDLCDITQYNNFKILTFVFALLECDIKRTVLITKSKAWILSVKTLLRKAMILNTNTNVSDRNVTLCIQISTILVCIWHK